MTKLKALAKDVQATLNTSVSGDVATCTFTVKENGDKGTPRYNLTWNFDYAEVSRKELILLAVRSHRIDGQADWRKAKNRLDSEFWQNRYWSARAMIDESPAKADPTTKVLKAAEKMTAAERTALMDLLKAM